MVCIPSRTCPFQDLSLGISLHLTQVLTIQGEDGIGGYSDTHQYICTSFAFWNEKDKILKERLFGVTGHQGTPLERL